MRRIDGLKALTWQCVGAGTVWFWLMTMLMLASLFSCSEKYEIVEPQTLRYEVTGENYYAVVYDKGAPKAPYMLEDYREIKNIFEKPAAIGDSISIIVLRGGTPWEQYDAEVKVWLGDELVARGDTRETGFLSIHGVLGKGYFVEKKK